MSLLLYRYLSKMKVHIDIETYSELNVNKVGVYRYAEHHSTEILCIAWAIDKGSVKIWAPCMGSEIPRELEEALLNKDVDLCAHNAQFERVVMGGLPGRRLGIPPTGIRRWYCTAAKAAYHSLPRALDNVAKALKLRRKVEGGKFVMYALSKPKKPSKVDPGTRFSPEKYPEKYGELFKYCMGDVEAEREVDQRLAPLPPFERETYILDQVINERGAHIDFDLVYNVSYLAEIQAETLRQKFNEITGLNPTQSVKILEWLKTQGYSYSDTAKETIDIALAESREEITPEAIKALQIRRVANKSSISKYQALQRIYTGHGKTAKIQGCLLYHGANTGRWAGKHFQPHNLPRGELKKPKHIQTAIKAVNERDIEFLRVMYPSPNTIFSSLLRSTIIPEPGKLLAVADFASIEARVLGWIAREEGYQTAFKNKEDLYVNLAMKIYEWPREKITEDERFLGKTGILALGYGMGLSKFIATCQGYGMKVPDSLLEKALDTYRKTYKSIVKFWYAVEGKAVEAVADKKITHLNGLSFAVHDNFLKIKLPSGRSLHYYRPFLKDKETPWGEMRPALHFLGENSLSKQFCIQNTYGGKLVENIVQAISRDLLCCAIYRVESHPNYEIIMHVHDEIIAQAEPDKLDLNEFESLMLEIPKWAKGLPMGAEAWSGERYRK